MTTIDVAPVDPELANDEPIFTHIVFVEEGEDATAVVLAARINGTPITALCGHVWVPSRDPKKHPICQKCVAIFEAGEAMSGSDRTPDDIPT